MLVTFQSGTNANIVMFGDSAVSLLKYMGHSGTVPGAILAKDVTAALANLLKKLDPTLKSGNKRIINPDDEESPPRIELSLRAWPLINMLSLAIEEKCGIMWD